MGKFVKGSFRTVGEAKVAIEEAVAEGYDRKLVTLFTNRETANDIPEDWGVGINTAHTGDQNNDADKTITDEVKDAFSAKADRENNPDQNPGYQADEKTLDGYKEDLNSGRIVVVVDDFSTEPGAEDLTDSTPDDTGNNSI